MRRKTLGLIIVWLFLIGVSPALAASHRHEEAGIELDAPAGWIVSPVEHGVMMVEAPDHSLAIFFWVPEDTWDGAVAGINESLETIVESPFVTVEPAEGELNGMKTVELAGTGSVAGVGIEWKITLISARKPLLALAFANPVAWQANVESADALLKSVRSID
jgi:hypothetical protein